MGLCGKSEKKRNRKSRNYQGIVPSLTPQDVYKNSCKDSSVGFS